jgi:hypothetical protein
VDRQPSAALLLPCVDPVLVPDPETATDEQVEVERVNVARAYADCRQRHVADVREAPTADQSELGETALLDHFVGTGQNRGWHD